MQLFLATADVREIRDAARIGVISAVTTNPSLAAAAGVAGREAYRLAVREIAELVNGPISVEVVATDAPGMVAEGRDIAEWIPDPWVKIPSTIEGIEAIAALSAAGIKVNQTLCFSVNQAILGAQAGAAAVSPFIGRLDDIGQDGIGLLRDIADLFRNAEIETLVMAASVRHPLHCVKAAQAGAHIATVPYQTLLQMAQHPLTDAGLARFITDWQKATQA